MDYTASLGKVSRGIGYWESELRVSGGVLSIILALAILGALGVLGYVIVNPEEESFTEFYILGLSGYATDYSDRLVVGEEGKVMVGIINWEHEPVTYRVEVGGVKNNEVGPVMFERNEGWEDIVSFTLDRAGDKQEVEFLLCRQG